MDGIDNAAITTPLQNDESELPIFDVQRVQLRFDISADFAAAQVANNILILALTSGRILRFDLDNAQDIDGTSRTRRLERIRLSSDRY